MADGLGRVHTGVGSGTNGPGPLHPPSVKIIRPRDRSALLSSERIHVLNARLAHTLTAAAAAATITVGGLAVPAPAGAAARHLHCAASVSKKHPSPYTYVNVYVKTKAKTKIRTTAHYKTTDTTHTARANSKGRATVEYYISGATHRFKVKIDVRVKRNDKTGSCSTSFTTR